MASQCKICEKSFDSDKGLHTHIKRIHKIPLSEYYVNFYQRKDLFTNELLPFKDKIKYFSSYFLNRDNFEKWANSESPDKVKNIMLKMLKHRIEQKELKHAPPHIELQLYDLPSIDSFRKFFGSYSIACDELKTKPLFEKKIMENFFDEDDSLDSVKILIDTREQRPLKFKSSLSMKLDFGDYAVGEPYYDYTYVDRKSESDFKSTMSIGFERFKREIERAKSFDAYLFVVIESSIEEIIKNNPKGHYEANLAFVWHNMRTLMHDFAKRCQFIFTGSRANSEKIIPKLLVHGNELWDTDIQYFIDKHELGRR